LEEEVGRKGKHVAVKDIYIYIYIHMHREKEGNFVDSILYQRGRDSSVGIATGCSLDGPGIEFR
jgi:hypothetical protein